MVRLYTFPDKRSDFLEWQARSLAAFARDPVELVVINNGSTSERIETVRQAALALGLKHIDLPEKHHENPNVACAYPIDWAIQNLIAPDRQADISVIIDSDMFLAAPFSFSEFLGDFELVALPQRRGPVRYIWNGLVMLNHRTLQDLSQLSFHCTGCRGICPEVAPPAWQEGKILGQNVDVGGAAYFYFQSHPACRWKTLYSTHHITAERRNLHALPVDFLPHYDPAFCFELLEQSFLHYGSGSNWKGQSPEYHQRKTAALRSLLDGCFTGQYHIPNLPDHAPYQDRSYDARQYIDTIKYLAKLVIHTVRSLGTR